VLPCWPLPYGSCCRLQLAPVTRSSTALLTHALLTYLMDTLCSSVRGAHNGLWHSADVQCHQCVQSKHATGDAWTFRKQLRLCAHALLELPGHRRQSPFSGAARSGRSSPSLPWILVVCSGQMVNSICSNQLFSKSSCVSF